jgi:hypothetical protein
MENSIEVEFLIEMSVGLREGRLWAVLLLVVNS